jgi:glycosyltransferase involved in cell wall biosynthesis
MWGGAPRFVVGTVGRLRPVKNQSSLLRAVSLLIERSPSLRNEIGVAIIGDGPERARLEQQVQAENLQDVVAFLGARDDVADLLAHFDVFVLPSLAEGISNTVLEAMATGLPVIATRVGGNPELIEDGLTGRLVPPEDSETMARSIADYFSDRTMARRHGRAARQAVVQRFSLERMIADYVSLYDNLLASRTDSPAHASAGS